VDRVVRLASSEEQGLLSEDLSEDRE